ncbi:hypothetical protein [Frigidibacter sp. SD6-1]|uniref:hypothetical protein n=1 Tax=Frigidibacter sp. SD6-1 TaxID=3032581 RepID=UPI0024DF7FEE|nr:hypothetical protein [Frigidibacter sp. SD6-1]
MQEIFQHNRFGMVPSQTDYAELKTIRHAGREIEVLVSGSGFSARDYDAYGRFLDDLPQCVEKAKNYVKENYESVLGFAFAGWIQDAPEVMLEHFPELLQYPDLNFEMVWSKFSLRSVRHCCISHP